MMRNGRSDALESLREYISTRATETFGTQLGAIAAVGSVAIVRFATEAYDQWELQNASQPATVDEGPQQMEVTTQVIGQEELRAAADELLAEMEEDSNQTSSSRGMEASSSETDAQSRLLVRADCLFQCKHVPNLSFGIGKFSTVCRTKCSFSSRRRLDKSHSTRFESSQG